MKIPQKEVVNAELENLTVQCGGGDGGWFGANTNDMLPGVPTAMGGR